jgi:hypothetical protein
MFVAYRAPQRGDRHTQVRFFHDRTRPHAAQQLSPGYQRPGMFHEDHQHIECPWGKSDGLVIAEEETFVHEQPEATESVPRWLLGVGL